MSEAEVIKDTDQLVTKASLITDFKKLGNLTGETIIVHSSLSSLGWVSGGAVAVIQALMEVVTKAGTIIMPTFTADNSNPANWENPPVPKEWGEKIKVTRPAYQPEITPTRGMGKIPEIFRSFPEVIRSIHPTYSFAAWGKNEEEIIKKHPVDYPLGEKSPLADIYDLAGSVLLLGVGYENNTSFHLAEYRVSNPKVIKREAARLEEGKRVWKEYKDVKLKEELFAELGRDFEESEQVAAGKVGQAKAKLFSQRSAVDFARQWLENKKKF